MIYIPIIADDVLAEIEAETLSMIRRLRDTERLAREVSDALEYTLKNMKTGEVK